MPKKNEKEILQKSMKQIQSFIEADPKSKEIHNLLAETKYKLARVIWEEHMDWVNIGDDEKALKTLEEIDNLYH